MTIASPRLQRRIAALAAFATVAVAAPARAQTADAETLFREAKRLMKSGDIAEACKRFDASERLEPSTGTELNLANCLELNHQTATAWAMFVKAEASARRGNDPKREAEARHRADTLEKQLVYLTIDVPADHRVPGLQVRRNDLPVDEVLWHQRTPVDPADYTIAASADGYEPWQVKIAVTSSQRVEVPALAKQDVHDAPAVVVTAAAAPSPRQRLRRAPLAIGIAGVAAVGAGIALGLASNSNEQSSNALCPTTACSQSQALAFNSRARTEAVLADVAYGAGTAAIAAAVTWWLLAGTSTTERIAWGPMVDHAGIAAMGRF